MKESYGNAQKFHKKSMELIATINTIVEDLTSQGYRLTLRQLYYQLVAGAHIPNTVRSYDNIGALLTNARLAGLVDWDAIEDRTRGFISRSHWDNGSDMLRSAARSYHEDLWAGQDTRLFVVVEKEALAGILERTCHQYDVDLLPARGYPSVTTLREFAKERIMGATRQIVILHLGDHDPSGMDMSRDLRERLEMFSRFRVPIDFRRVALNMDQIEEQQPPPNPAKTTDARFAEYQSRYGDDSWELDALSPKFLHDLVSTEIEAFIDVDVLKKKKARIESIRERLYKLAANFKD